MRKLSLLVISSLTLLSMLALGTSNALAEEDPDCAGKPPGVQGFHFGTTNKTGLATSEVWGGAALCGTETEQVAFLERDMKGGWVEGYILTPGNAAGGVGKSGIACANPYGTKGHEQYCTGDDMPEGTYFGRSGVRIQQCLATGGKYNLGNRCASNIASLSYLYVGKSPGNPKPSDSVCNRPTVVQCLQSTDELSLGYGNITVEPCWAVTFCPNAVQGINDLDPGDNRYVMHIYPLNSLGAGPVYYTQIGEPLYKHPTGPEPAPRDFQLCEFANVVNPSSKECGQDPNKWIQKNPKAGTYACPTPQNPFPAGEGVRPRGVGTLKDLKSDRCAAGSWT